MDPWLESPRLFPGLHDSLLTYLRDELQTRLPDRYYADLQDRLYLADANRWIVPDVRGSEREGGEAHPAARASRGASPALVVSVPAVEMREPFVEIRDTRSGDRVVTVIEVLSPDNKRAGSTGRKQYRKKQHRVLRSEASLVEIDLLRGGRHTVALPPGSLPADAPKHYRVVVRRGTRPDEREVYAIGLRDELPRIAVPLRGDDPDVVVDLGALVARAYEGGAYWKRLDYAAEPDPAFADDGERAWARERVASAAGG